MSSKGHWSFGVYSFVVENKKYTRRGL